MKPSSLWGSFPIERIEIANSMDFLRQNLARLYKIYERCFKDRYRIFLIELFLLKYLYIEYMNISIY